MSSADDHVRALETGSITPMGEVEQAGLLAHGLKHNARRRRRGVRFLLAAVGLVCLVVAVAALFLG